MSDYKKNLKAADKAGASKATGLPHLAQMCAVLALAHPALNPEMVFNGAVKKNIDGDKLRKMPPVDIGNLMFVD